MEAGAPSALAGVSPPPSLEGDADEEAVAEFVAECEMPTDRGTFRMRSYR